MCGEVSACHTVLANDSVPRLVGLLCTIMVLVLLFVSLLLGCAHSDPENQRIREPVGTGPGIRPGDGTGTESCQHFATDQQILRVCSRQV